MENLFNKYFMERLDLFWSHDLGNEIGLDIILKALRRVLNPDSIENCFNKLELSDNSKSLIYLILGESCRRATKRQENADEYELKPDPKELVEMIALKFGEQPFTKLYLDIFNVLEIDDFYHCNGKDMEFLDYSITHYERTSLLIPQEYRFELKKWLSQKGYLMRNAQFDKSKSLTGVTVLSVSQKLVILHAMFEKLGVKIGHDINKSDFLRFFQSLTNHELNVPYQDTSFRKEYTRLFTRRRSSKVDDFSHINNLLEGAGLMDVKEWIEDKYKI